MRIRIVARQVSACLWNSGSLVEGLGWGLPLQGFLGLLLRVVAIAASADGVAGQVGAFGLISCFRTVVFESLRCFRVVFAVFPGDRGRICT